MIADRKLLISALQEPVEKIRFKKDVVKDIKKALSRYKILEGRVQELLNDPMLLHKIEDFREVVLFTEQIYSKTGISDIDPGKYYTKDEIEESRTYNGLEHIKKREMRFPLTIPDVLHVAEGEYTFVADALFVAELLENRLLNYEYEIQREPTRIKRGDKVILRPTTNMKNIKEMVGLMLKDNLFRTQLIFNAELGSADSGEELSYDPDDRTLTINAGTKLDILDGYHRCMATKEAARKNSELGYVWQIKINNASLAEAQKGQAQIAKAQPITTVRQKELEEARQSDKVVKQLRIDSELQNKISSKPRPNYAAGEVVSSSVLADAIDREFKLKKNFEVVPVAEYLKDFFSHLFGYFPEAFEDNIQKVRSESLINANTMFNGYILLAKRMKDSNIPLTHLKDILNQIDFSRKSDNWKDILNNDNYIQKSGIKTILEKFRNLNIE